MASVYVSQGVNNAPVLQTIGMPLSFAALVPILTVVAPTAYLIGGTNGALAPLAGVADLDVGFIIPVAGTISNLYVLSGAVGAGSKHAYTVYKNGVATTLTCTTGLNGGAANDTTHSFTVVAGDVISVRVDRNTADSLAVVGKASLMLG